MLASPIASGAIAGPADGTNLLSDVIVREDGPIEGGVILDFSSQVPQYTILTNDRDEIMLALAGTVRGAGAIVGALPPGVVRSVSFAQQGQILTVTLRGDGKLHLAATPLSSRSVLLRVTRLRGEDAVQADTGPRPVPHPSGDTPGDLFVLIPLKFADVSEVVGLLTNDKTVKPNDLFTPQEPAFGSVGAGGPNGANPALAVAAMTAQTDTSLGQSIDDTIAIDRRLNAIILRGKPELVERLRGQIEQIDQPVGSVILETVFVELTQSGARNLGFDFANGNGQIVSAVYQTGPYSAEGGGHVSSGYALQAKLSAQIQKGEGRIISKPRISAQSGSTAKIVTGDALPILTSITLSGVNGVSQQVQYVNVGVTLQIAPRVSSNGYVTSHVFCVVSSVTGTSQGYPTISQREASTSATVQDGESFVIGGLSQESRLGSDSKVPLLGDVPLLGGLAHSRAQTSSKTDLYIIVTPHILRERPPAMAGQP